MFDPRFALFLAGWPRSGDYGLLVEVIEASVGTGIPGVEPQGRREQSRVGPLPRRLVSFESTSSAISRQWSGVAVQSGQVIALDGRLILRSRSKLASDWWGVAFSVPSGNCDAGFRGVRVNGCCDRRVAGVPVCGLRVLARGQRESSPWLSHVDLSGRTLVEGLSGGYPGVQGRVELAVASGR